MPFGQFNIARSRWPLDDPRMAGFTDNIDRINALAKRTEGFVWLEEHRDGEAEALIMPDDPRMTHTISVWRDLESLRRFTWSTVHKRFRMRRSEWFERLGSAYLAIWPIAEGHLPSRREALAKLDELRRTGPNEQVFGTEILAPAAA